MGDFVLRPAYTETGLGVIGIEPIPMGDHGKLVMDSLSSWDTCSRSQGHGIGAIVMEWFPDDDGLEVTMSPGNPANVTALSGFLTARFTANGDSVEQIVDIERIGPGKHLYRHAAPPSNPGSE